MAKHKISDLTVGQFYEKTVTVTEEIGQKFAEVSGDFNPIHLDEEVAATTRFGKRIVHGMLFGSYISGIIGNEFPGEGSVYISQDLSFKRPAFYNSPVTIRVEVAEINEEKKRVKLKTCCINEEGKMITDGLAEILLDN